MIAWASIRRPTVTEGTAVVRGGGAFREAAAGYKGWFAALSSGLSMRNIFEDSADITLLHECSPSNSRCSRSTDQRARTVYAYRFCVAWFRVMVRDSPRKSPLPAGHPPSVAGAVDPTPFVMSVQPRLNGFYSVVSQCLHVRAASCRSRRNRRVLRTSFMAESWQRYVRMSGHPRVFPTCTATLPGEVPEINGLLPSNAFGGIPEPPVRR